MQAFLTPAVNAAVSAAAGPSEAAPPAALPVGIQAPAVDAAAAQDGAAQETLDFSLATRAYKANLVHTGRVPFLVSLYKGGPEEGDTVGVKLDDLPRGSDAGRQAGGSTVPSLNHMMRAVLVVTATDSPTPGDSCFPGWLAADGAASSLPDCCSVCWPGLVLAQ